MSKCVSGFEMTPIRGLAFVQIRAGSGHFGTKQPSLVLVSCEIGSGLGSRIKFFFPKFQSPFGSGTT
jgi:hypothetical protein